MKYWLLLIETSNGFVIFSVNRKPRFFAQSYKCLKMFMAFTEKCDIPCGLIVGQ